MKAVVLLSGGMDSSTLLYFAKASGFEPLALAVNYGQRHSVELLSAVQVAASAGVPIQVADLSRITPILGGSSQTDESIPVPEGHYTDPSMKATVVPNRNMLMLSLAAAHAIASGASRVLYAAHAGDHPIYPDCRPEFVMALQQALRFCHYEPIVLDAPFVTVSKAEIVKLGTTLGVPFELTWSCYQGRVKHCGKCGTCVERREAFELAGVPDPTRYA